MASVTGLSYGPGHPWGLRHLWWCQRHLAVLSEIPAPLMAPGLHHSLSKCRNEWVAGGTLKSAEGTVVEGMGRQV